MRSRRPALIVVVLALGASLLAPGVAQAGLVTSDGTEPVVVRMVDDTVRSVDVAPDQIPYLEADPQVAGVLRRGAKVGPAMAVSVPLVGAPALWSGGARGAGKVIAVIDTGVTPSFGGALVGQACFAATQVPGSSDLIGHCGPASGEERAFSSACFDLGVCDAGDPSFVLDPAAGRPCASPPPAQPGKCAHGSGVAAIAARHAAPAGVAPDAGVYAIQVFDPQGTGADLVDVFLALDHVVHLVDAGMEVVAVNLSLATSELFSTACDSIRRGDIDGPAFASVLGRLRDRGVAAAIATGNSGVDGRVAFPACLSAGVSVGATDLDDDIAPFSNTSAATDLLAPGATNGSSPLTVPSGTGFSQWSGTSFAAPHVAGAFALLAERYPKASVVQRAAHLRATGVPVGSLRRLRMRAPAAALNAQVLFPADAPIAGTARSAVGDFDGDGRGDVLAHGPGSAPDRISYGTDRWALDVRSRPVAGSYVPLAGSFRGPADGPDDVLWYAPGAAADSLWVGQPNRLPTSAPLSIGGTYLPIVGDFDGDGWDDVIWYAPGATADFVWYGGLAGFTARPLALSGAWQVAVGDFNGDARDDLLLHAPGAATDAVWRGSAARGSFTKSPVALTSSFTLVVANVDGDAHDDVVLYQPGAGKDYLWRGGPGVGGAGPAGGFAQESWSVSGTYTPVPADVDGDGLDDLLWYAPGAAIDWIWFGRPSGALPSRSVAISGTYTPLTADLDADDGDELVFFRATSTTTPVWWSYVGAP